MSASSFAVTCGHIDPYDSAENPRQRVGLRSTCRHVPTICRSHRYVVLQHVHRHISAPMSTTSTCLQDVSKCARYIDISSPPSSCGLDLQKRRVSVDHLASPTLSGENADLLELLEILRGSLACSDSCINQELDLAVGLREHQFDELLRVRACWKLSSALLQSLLEEIPDGEDPICRPRGRFDNPIELVENPLFPFQICSNA